VVQPHSLNAETVPRKLKAKEVTAARWTDFEKLFEARGSREGTRRHVMQLPVRQRPPKKA
jgi:hypothetical protein